MVLVEDNGPIHTSKLSLAALAARAHWLTVEWLPKYAPELNDIEVVWHDLKNLWGEARLITPSPSTLLWRRVLQTPHYCGAGFRHYSRGPLVFRFEMGVL